MKHKRSFRPEEQTNRKSLLAHTEYGLLLNVLLGQLGHKEGFQNRRKLTFGLLIRFIQTRRHQAICIHRGGCFYFHQPKSLTGTYRRISLTCIWWLTGVPDQDTSIIRGAGKHVVIDRTDRQTVHGVDMQEHIQSFSPAGTTIIHHVKCFVGGNTNARQCLDQHTAVRFLSR